LGLFLRMPARPVEMVQSIASKMNVPLREIYLMRSSAAQALALPNRQRLVFTDRLIEILTEAELAAVAAHELGHLTEARGDYYKRYVVWCFALPWIFLKPVLHACGVAGFLLLLCTSMLALSLFRKFSHKLELRADSIAKSRELDEGCYATALLKLYEDNLLPAVNANKRSTHPHLYDRVETAGITPDFPRPAPPSTMSWPLLLTSIALGILAVELIERVLGHL
jgi:Zn-dependent protease with chaperone function